MYNNNCTFTNPSWKQKTFKNNIKNLHNTESSLLPWLKFDFIAPPCHLEHKAGKNQITRRISGGEMRLQLWLVWTIGMNLALTWAFENDYMLGDRCKFGMAILESKNRNTKDKSHKKLK